MEQKPRSDDDAAQPTAASEWLVALLERPDDTLLRARFSAWLTADPAHAADWAEIARTYEAMGRAPARYPALWRPLAEAGAGPRPLPVVGLPPAASRPPSHRPPSHRPPRRSGRRLALGLAAAALAACLAVAVAPGLLLRLGADHATATGETRTVLLEDGSKAWLAPESILDVSFSVGERRVTLQQGAAFFEVTPDATRPFRVSGGPLQATALGTAFEVRLEQQAAVVAVREGRVGVEGPEHAAGPPVVLKAGGWLRLAEDGGLSRGALPAGQVAAWRDGRLIAKDRPVGEVVDELRRYYAGLVILRGATLARQPLTGVYNLSDPVAALRAVASAQGASVSQLTPWVLVISGG